MEKELKIVYDGMKLRIKPKNVGGNFDNDFEMCQLKGRKRILLMSYQERWDDKGCRVEVFSKGVLEKDRIEQMMRTLLPLTTLVENATLKINE